MTEPVRKYLTEFGLHTFSSFSALLQQDQFVNLPPDFPECHIYLICRRPRVMLEETISVDEHTASGRFAIIRGDKQEFHSYIVPNGLGRANVTLSCPYPYTHFFIKDPRGNVLSEGMTSLFVSQFKGVDSSLFNLEVLYVGQAFGKDGERCSPQRLGNHSTLQAIYLDAMQKAPDQEVWIVLCHFDANLVQVTDPRAHRVERSDEEEHQHIRNIVSKVPVKEELEVNFTEAGLIRYFQPQYNVHFKDLFPSPTHASYRECYDLDINSVSVEIGSDNLLCQLWSPTAPPQWTHIAKYPLYSSKERRDMLDLAGLKPGD